MPLIVRDHTWTQNQNTVYISVPLKGVKTAKVHVICTDEYLKVRFEALNVKLLTNIYLEKHATVC